MPIHGDDLSRERFLRSQKILMMRVQVDDVLFGVVQRTDEIVEAK
jgi:hypothetical protein